MSILSDGDLGLIRTPLKWSEGYIVIPQFNVIYAAVLNGVPTSNDQVTQLGYASGVGTLSNVKVDMTVRVGSTAGGYDLGLARIRKAPDGSYIYIGATSDINWAASSPVYLTIVDEFGLWPRAIGVDASGNPLMDWDTACSDQHTNFDPVPILGGHVVATLTGASVSVRLGPPSGMSSYVPGSSVTGVSWSIPGAVSIDNVTLVNPTAAFNAAGTYPCYCTVNGANGKSFWGVIYVIILDTNHPPVKAMLSQRSADYTSCGWSFSVSLSGDAGITSIPPHAMVIRINNDYFNGVQQTAPSPISGSNIVCVGWISDEKVDFNGAYGQADFTVQGAAYFLQNMHMSGVNLTYSPAPAAWTQMSGLTVDRYLYHCLRWRCTATRIMDVTLTGNANLAQSLQSGDDTLWNQMTTILDNNLFGIMGVDWYGRLWAQIEPQMVPVANRTWNVVQTLTKQDWQNNNDATPGEVWEWDTMNAVGIYAMTGLNFTGAGTPSTLYGMSPGHTAKRWGAASKTVKEQPLVASQAELNSLCGLYVGWQNNDHPNFDITLPANYRAVDLWPVQFFSITIDPADDVRRKGYSGHIIPRKLTFTTDANGYEVPQLNAEGETFPEIGINGDVPASQDTKLPKMPTIPMPIDGGGLIQASGAPGTVVMSVSVGGSIKVFYTTNANASDPTKVHWLPMNDGINPTDATQVIAGRVYVSPVSGECWLPVAGYYSTYNYLYYAPSLGSSWTVVLDITKARTITGMPNPLLSSLGINLGAADEVMAVIGEGAGGGSHGMYWFHGSSAGFIAGSMVNFNGGNGFYGGSIVYGNNRWTNVIGNGFITYAQWCNRTGGSPNYNVNALTLSGYGTTPYITRGGKDGSVFYITNAFYTTPTRHNNLVKSVDNGVTLADITTAPFPSLNLATAPVTSSPDGTYLMAGDPAGIQSKKSADGGATWGNIGIVGSYQVFYCYGTNYLWLTEGAYFVKYSTDGGDTWTDITGDLWSWLPVGSGWSATYIIGW